MVDQETRLIGKRVKLIRNIINEGGKLSVEQFAYILDETGDKLRNYELCRAAVPNRVLQTLYSRGISITFIVTGEGDVFNTTPAGVKLKKVVANKKVDVMALWNEIYEEMKFDSLRTAEAKARKRELREKAKEQQRLEKEAAKAKRLQEKQEAARLREENRIKLAELRATKERATQELKIIPAKNNPTGKKGRPAKEKVAAGDMNAEKK